ncbi:MAG: helix-turn-helix transcriptional regulator [Lachnospiraceae bacterium]|nr:helix-turn-helix transcriptional regulator [Lachnospiraceae bacterium]
MFYHQPHNSTGNYSYNAFIYNNVNYKPHFHKNFELVHVISGHVHCTAGEKSATLSTGDYALFLSNEVHSVCSVGSSQCWIGVFSGDFVHTFEKQVKNKTGSTFIFQCEKSINDFLTMNLIKEIEPPLHLLKACLYAACFEFSNQVTFSEQKNKSDLLMRSITDYISENYNNKINLSDISEALGYNYHYLSKCFHKIFKMPFTDFLNSYRLDAALGLLTETDKEITEIALESGFQSIRSFNDVFKTYTGTTPSKYRAELTHRKHNN